MGRKAKGLNIFISYSHKNMKYKEKLLVSLKALENSYSISSWHDGEINAGGNIDENVKTALCEADIVLLLVTDNFLASYYCMKIELENAIQREKEGKCIVIPVMFQESVLTSTLAFAKHNRVPEDGKPIATGFQNQAQGCTRAVNMIKKLIDDKFPSYAKTAVKAPVRKPTRSPKLNSPSVMATSIGKTKAIQNNPLYIGLYKNGKLNNVPVNQNILDTIPQCYKSIHMFRTMMDQALDNAKKQYSEKTKHNKKTGSPLTNSERLELLRLYLMDICAYTKTYITGNTGIKVHFRASKNDFYVGLIASTDSDDAVDLASDWTTKMTPIPMYKGLIYYSSYFHAPFIKSLNLRQNFKATNDKTWKDYITFTFPKFHSGQTPLISYCISIHREKYKDNGDILKILAYLNIGDIIEKYIYDYCEICKRLDKMYDIESVINSL